MKRLEKETQGTPSLVCSVAALFVLFVSPLLASDSPTTTSTLRRSGAVARRRLDYRPRRSPSSIPSRGTCCSEESC